MSIKGDIIWEGVDAYRDHILNVLSPAMKAALEAACDRAGDDGEERMKMLVPVDTGDLQSTCRKKSGRDPTQAGEFHVTLIAGGMRGKRAGNLVNYAGYVEFGTSRQRPQPFLRPSIRWAARAVEPYFWEELERRVKIE